MKLKTYCLQHLDVAAWVLSLRLQDYKRDISIKNKGVGVVTYKSHRHL